MSVLQAIILGIIEGITEFLPISSTGHLTIAEKLMGQKIDDPGITAFTAIIQVGAIFATIIYFRKDIASIISGFVRGLFSAEKRHTPEFRMGVAVIVGSIPIAVIGLLFKDHIETTLRSLWFVAGALILWSGVMWLADKYGKQRRVESEVTWRDTLFVGFMQCVALIPGVSRSGATISAGLFRGLERTVATRLSFFLAIPALVAAAGLESVQKAGDISNGVGWSLTILAMSVSFVSAYASIAWLLRYIAKHDFRWFIAYRIALGILLIVLLTTGVIEAV